MISKLKAAGVSSVVLFTDIAMTGAMTKIATQQQYSPEWLITGYQYQDISLLARTSYDQDQWAHAFGISTLFPYVNGANTNQTLAAWYWGPNRGDDRHRHADQGGAGSPPPSSTRVRS